MVVLVEQDFPERSSLLVMFVAHSQTIPVLDRLSVLVEKSGGGGGNGGGGRGGGWRWWWW